jgi:hypothetical protein
MCVRSQAASVAASAHVARVPRKRLESFTLLHFFSARHDYLRRSLAQPAKDGTSHDVPNETACS